VAPVRLALWTTREIEVEARREASRARAPREYDAQHVAVLVIGDERAEKEQIRSGTRRDPVAPIAACPSGRRHLEAFEAGEGVAKLGLEDEQVEADGLHAHQQAVERRDVDAGRVEPALERLNERGARARKRIENSPADRDLAAEQLLDELGGELAEIRVQAVDMLRALALRKIALGPGEVEVELRVERVLRRRRPRFVLRRLRDLLPRVRSERVPKVLDAARALDDHVEACIELSAVGPRREPRIRCTPQAAHLLRRHHLERVAEAGAALGLDLAEDERAASARDDVELVAADPDVRGEDAVAAQSVPPRRTALGGVPRLRPP